MIKQKVNWFFYGVKTFRDIIEWAKTNETAVPDNAQVASMDECTFNDLRIRLGCPYVFLHQGDCEHQIHFKDIRFVFWFLYSWK